MTLENFVQNQKKMIISDKKLIDAIMKEMPQLDMIAVYDRLRANFHTGSSKDLAWKGLLLDAMELPEHHKDPVTLIEIADLIRNSRIDYRTYDRLKQNYSYQTRQANQWFENIQAALFNSVMDYKSSLINRGLITMRNERR